MTWLVVVVPNNIERHVVWRPYAPDERIFFAAELSAAWRAALEARARRCLRNRASDRLVVINDSGEELGLSRLVLVFPSDPAKPPSQNLASAGLSLVPRRAGL